MSDIPERDWKLLRELKPLALERFCEKVLSKAVKIADSKNLTNYQRYGKLYSLIHEQDREIMRAFDDHRRSTAFMKIVEMHSLGLFSEEEFSRFSEETRRFVLEIAKM